MLRVVRCVLSCAKVMVPFALVLAGQYLAWGINFYMSGQAQSGEYVPNPVMLCQNFRGHPSFYSQIMGATLSLQRGVNKLHYPALVLNFRLVTLW